MKHIQILKVHCAPFSLLVRQKSNNKVLVSSHYQSSVDGTSKGVKIRRQGSVLCVVLRWSVWDTCCLLLRDGEKPDRWGTTSCSRTAENMAENQFNAKLFG